MERSQLSPIQENIAVEMRALLHRHGCDLETAERLCDLPPPELAARVYEVLEILGARPHLLAIIASYGDVLDDESVLELLRIAHPHTPISLLRVDRGENVANHSKS